MRLCVLTMMVALSLCVGGCGGSTDYSGGNPATPTHTTTNAMSNRARIADAV